LPASTNRIKTTKLGTVNKGIYLFVVIGFFRNEGTGHKAVRSGRGAPSWEDMTGIGGKDVGSGTPP
jgi:hypothetical protein